MKKKTKIGLGLLILAILGGVYFQDKVLLLFASGKTTVNKNQIDFYIKKTSTLADLAENLIENKIIDDAATFVAIGEYKELTPQRIALGKYQIKPKTPLKTLLNGFTINSKGNGNAEVEVTSTFNICDNIYEVAGKATQNIMADSSMLVDYLLNPELLKKYGFTVETLPSLFFPNSYNMFWDTNEEEFVARMAQEYKKFWTSDRKEKLQRLGLTSQSDLTTIASIVYKEQNRVEEEWGIIGRLYLNRVKDNWLLQSDPTFKFCWGDKLDGVKRLTYKHREVDCPYNTYKYPGLPPGPICVPPAKVLDAILNAAPHNYYFMCAKPGYSGYHNFANGINEHNRNAKIYQNWLTKENIR
ncbi:MAG: endolytic transglycosylase MltG [Lishizhenia sp.]